MKVLATTKQINIELTRLIEECSLCRIAVAWASVGFSVYELLQTHEAKIEQMTVGIHFYQTDPTFIERFLSHPKVRFVLNPAGVFHPKIYLFLKQAGKWECLIGSPNFTNGGLNVNDEICVLMSDADVASEAALNSVCARMDAYWAKASPISPGELQIYREAWERKRPIIDSLRGKFGKSAKNKAGDGGKNPLTVPVLQMSWPGYFHAVKNEKDRLPGRKSIEERLKVIRAAKGLFHNHEHFNQIAPSDRPKLAGLVVTDAANFFWFGSMRGGGHFRNAIKRNDDNLSIALDQIPATGPVSRSNFLAYVHQFRKSLPSDKIFIASATRLLAMKRPDYFICFDARNKITLCKAFGIKQTIDYEDYWDSIIERIVKESAWWNASAPAPGPEREVWEARAAFLDALYYDGKDMPPED
jgi:HKD family nuclease